MEPFGLFDLLKTLLPTAPTTEENLASPPTNPQPASAPPNPQTQPPSEPSYYPCQQNNPCWAFMERHDARAKTVKKRSD